MRFTTPCPFNGSPIRLTADRSVQALGATRRLRSTQVVAGAAGLLLFAPAVTFALELGEASVQSGLGQSLLVEIPYRLAASEELASGCVQLVPATRGSGALPTYTGVSRISITPTHIELFDDRAVREPLIGLNVEVRCETVPHLVRSYELFVDLPAQIPTMPSDATRVAAARPAIDAAAPVAAGLLEATPAIPSRPAPISATTDPTASRPTRAARANASPRARGHAGGNLTQGQTYRVVRGDTLSGIAARIAGRPATIRQTADAIFAANPQAFTRGNRDLIEEGRAITIPQMTSSTAAFTAPSAPSAPAPLSAIHEAELPTAAPVATVDPTPAPPLRAEDAASAVAADPGEPRPAATAVVETPSAASVPAATRAAPALAAPRSAATGRTSAWLTALLAIGVVVLLSAPWAFVRRRTQRATASAGGKAQKPRPRRPVDPIAGIHVVESQPARASSDDKAASIRSSVVPSVADSGAAVPADLKKLALAIAPTDPVDLDVGAPIMMSEGVDWFADREDAAAIETAAIDAADLCDAAIEEDTATASARLPGFDTAVTVRQQAPRSNADLAEPPLDDEQMTLTIVELDILRQDYEAEHTLTQASQALRDALADLEATKRARAATAETSTMEMPQQSEAETADSAASSQTARVRMK